MVLTERYFIKLIAIVGIAALIAAFKVIVAIFAKPDDTLTVEGEVITRAASPALWARVDGLCRRLGTQPVTHIVGGIDDNFFVTEHPVHLTGRELTGRTLFVSLSLLKRLPRARPTPSWPTRWPTSAAATRVLETHVAAPVAVPDLLRRAARRRPLVAGLPLHAAVLALVQLALSTSSRAREIRADRLAAEATSPMSMAGALCRVAAYSWYRARVEASLFNRNSGHDASISAAGSPPASWIRARAAPGAIRRRSRFRIRSTATRRSARGCRRSE